MRVLWTVLIFSMGFYSFALAFSYSVKIEFDEPTQDVGGAPISTYAHTRVKVWYIKRTGERVSQSDITIPASSPSGGGAVSYPVTFLDIDNYEWIEITAIASSDEPTRNSVKSNVVIHKIDRTPAQAPK